MDSPVRTSSRCLPPAPKKESAKSRFGDEWSKPKTARVVLYDKAGVSRDFDIIQRVASGSYGTVDAISNGRVLKVSKRALDTQKTLAWAEAAAQRYGRLSNATTSTHIVKLESAWVEGRCLHQIMERGCMSLADFIQRIDRDILLVCLHAIVSDMLQAVCQVHNAGLIHTDIKPSNFIVFEHKQGIRVKLGDFDQVRAVKPHSSSTQPEHPDDGDREFLGRIDMQQGQPTQATDIYALGLSIAKIPLCLNRYKKLIDIMTHDEPRERAEIGECCRMLQKF